ncbi:hypothetical protein COW36_16200 [bacterium (Candidatus Blackallbacteria) CG17_big_fil_post_rev_8_21_14_2_50_48_46]|uniref:Prolyl 4-hydroxylase alpha subunit Fe(2+) 2OG dioxygenase domain-containing protein n=1 Tax=bacterium (Candidatus Blackallbacteria) CG17_big_fil_post_rev_8_21_14_2_50_48_46 TaxID=2014261 RepID=A0A2M7G1Q1_9BACT|nr:MAG: hypothetical protein COW64_16670 [bacterium (Candidatus Blackallbacteria) CG18_big_fil_WC_8_21_14_2_50_49_26]PIW15678.1 MAG: hypothetical protein COW36_16200 [bacterium (Candidatus Blackallbacteria) CG17_big_fil_post_rev_8_21_14_2_50_48_46]PIW48683.1 MAG: hypothetical protein COW20_08380 [bacterium (Candidatus Blackallbacteria) CG13_big_fil_rev_8_21_14_2_50_49_14]
MQEQKTTTTPQGFEINDDLMRAMYYPDVFSPADCEKILTLTTDPNLSALFKEQTRQKMPDYYQQANFSTELLPYIPENNWIFDRLGKIIHTINQKYYHFEIENLAGTQRVTLAPEQGLDWHLEVGQGEFSLRKIKLLIFLSDPDSYTGGLIEFGSSSQRTYRQSLGGVLIYPTYFMTRIHPVQTGQFRFLQTWALGRNAFL